MSNTINKQKKRAWFLLSVCVNIGFLCIFKYYDFFAISFADAISHLGLQANLWLINVILPVGISFYTFHGLSYVIDIYNSKIKAEKNFINYAVFVSFFPLLVAGPIERATHLLPQIQKKRTFEYSKGVDGLRQILWGLFKKIVIADQCAGYVNMVFNNSSAYSGSTLFIGLLLFSFQLYCDFSGYSDIALGTARLFGIELLRNFAYPYFSRDIAELWRRWHISLTSWFKDYLYIPLGGSKGGTGMKVRNILIIFLVSGFWHGANWTFILWGLLNALYIMPSILFNTNRKHLDTIAQGYYIPTLRETLSMLLTFGLFSFSLILFRSKNLKESLLYMAGILKPSIYSMPKIPPASLFISIPCFLIIEWLSRERQHGLDINNIKIIKPVRIALYVVISYSILFSFSFHKPSEFIYFQF